MKTWKKRSKIVVGNLNNLSQAKTISFILPQKAGP
jgi:hypothetical protein